MRILALSDAATPWHSFWIRFGQYVPELGLPVEISTDAQRIAALHPGDTLLLYRLNTAWGDLREALIGARQRGVKLLADVDDYLWQAPGWTRPRLLAYTRALRLCQRISCSTTPLQEVLGAMFPRAQVGLLPNSTPPPRQAASCSAGPLVLCWTGAPWTRPQDLALLRPLAQWSSGRPEPLRWRHIGHAEGQLSFASALGLDPALVETEPLLPHQQYLAAIGGDIGLAPLAAGPFNAFKSELKLLEYSGLAMAWIASAAPAYGDLCQRWGWAGRLCRHPHDWIAHVEALLDPATRQREGQQLQRLAHSQQGHAQAVGRWRRWLLES
jgi:hypothetical protein